MNEFIYYKKKENINEGLVNMGFTSYEAIGEGIDDALDAGANNICIYVEAYEEEYYDTNNKVCKVPRISYMISDNGKACSVENLKNIFDFGKKDSNYINSFEFSNTENYKNKKEYFSYNKKYHYGMSAHINIGKEINIYSKSQNEDEYYCCGLKYDIQNKCGYTSDIRRMTDEEKEFFRKRDIKFSTNSGFILYVKGIDNTEINIKCLEGYLNNLIDILGYTYYDYLTGETYDSNKVSIKVNDKVVKPIHPLGLDLKNRLVSSRIFAEYNITLEEVLDEINDKKYSQELIYQYLKIFTEDELKNLSISIRLVAINKNLGNSKNISKKIKDKVSKLNLNKLYYPQMQNSGFYIKRNNKYIGTALGMLEIVKSHPSHTHFRGEISFSPIFDDLFKIQTNKNRNYLKYVIIQLIEKKIKDDETLVGDKASTKIIKQLRDNKDIHVDIRFRNKINYNENNSNKIKYRLRIIKSKATNIKNKLEKYYQDTDCINENLERVDRISLIDFTKLNKLEYKKIINDISLIEDNVTKIISEFEQNRVKKFKDIDFLISRVKRSNKQKKLVIDNIDDEKKLCLNNTLVPSVEGELYGLLKLTNSLYNEVFDFDLVNYHTRDGIDLIVELNKDVYEELGLEERFGSLKTKFNDEVYNNYIDENLDVLYSFIELKLDLKNEMDHSLELVSHVICWKKPNILFIKALDGLYTFTDKNKSLLVSDSGNKVKVIYLKDVIENMTGGSFC